MLLWTEVDGLPFLPVMQIHLFPFLFSFWFFSENNLFSWLSVQRLPPYHGRVQAAGRTGSAHGIERLQHELSKNTGITENAWGKTTGNQAL